MIDDPDHSACVDIWMKHVITGLPPGRALQTFAHAFNALWLRAHRTLGEVTLTAIVDRVLYTAAGSFPFLAGFQVGANGLCAADDLGFVHGLQEKQVTSAIRFVLVEFLTVLGSLTAEILSPALHAELSKLVLAQAGSAPAGAHAAGTEHENNDAKKAKS